MNLKDGALLANLEYKEFKFPVRKGSDVYRLVIEHMGVFSLSDQFIKLAVNQKSKASIPRCIDDGVEMYDHLFLLLGSGAGGAFQKGRVIYELFEIIAENNYMYVQVYNATGTNMDVSVRLYFEREGD